MERKVYKTPSIEIFEAQTIQMMAASTFGLSQDTIQSSEQLSHGHRGHWGNLWSEDEN